MSVDWAFVAQILPKFMPALGITLQATLAGMVVALTLGLLLALARRSHYRWLSWPAAGFVEFTRSTPLLVQIYFLFYVMPGAGLRMTPLWTGIIALGLHYSAYCAEVYRAGIEGIPKGQWEAAAALNLSPVQTLRRVIVPQAIPPVIPALGNYLIAMFKETPLLSTITVMELLNTAKVIGAESFRYVEAITLVGLFFLLLSLAASTAIRSLDGRLRHAWL